MVTEDDQQLGESGEDEMLGTWQELLFPTHLTYLALTLSAIKGDKDAWRKESGTIALYSNKGNV